MLVAIERATGPTLHRTIDQRQIVLVIITGLLVETVIHTLVQGGILRLTAIANY